MLNSTQKFPVMEDSSCIESSPWKRRGKVRNGVIDTSSKAPLIWPSTDSTNNSKQFNQGTRTCRQWQCVMDEVTWGLGGDMGNFCLRSTGPGRSNILQLTQYQTLRSIAM